MSESSLHLNRESWKHSYAGFPVANNRDTDNGQMRIWLHLRKVVGFKL